MFRHYRVILRELVTNTFQSYTSISNTVLVIQYKIHILILNCITNNYYLFGASYGNLFRATCALF